MPLAASNGIEICYEEFGDASDPPVLLIMGLGAQMITWDDEFCEELARRRLRVIRFDNRDVGLSTKIEGGGTPDIVAAVFAARAGGKVDPSYTLDDMGEDGFGLLDALGIDRAHVVGASMGGMIAQHMAMRRPDRVASLTSIMSTTGNPEVGQGRPEVLLRLFTPPPSDRAGYVAHMIEVIRAISGDALPFDADRARLRTERAYDRAYYPAGPPRQMLAVLAAGDWTPRLAEVRVPTLVIHGALDPLVDVSGGRATADAVPGARLVILDDGGHSLAPSHWPIVADEVAAHVASAEGAWRFA